MEKLNVFLLVKELKMLPDKIIALLSKTIFKDYDVTSDKGMMYLKKK